MTVDRSCPPPVSGFTGLHLEFPRCVSLRNGIPVWVIDNGEDDINRLTYYFDGGMLHEDRPYQAALTMATLAEGNAHRDAAAIAESFDYYGSLKQANSGDAHSVVSLSSLNDNFAGALEVMQQCVATATFPDHEFGIIRQQQVSNCEIALERVKYLAMKEMKRLYYGDGHPLSMRATPGDIAALTPDDALRFHRRHFVPARCRLVLAGRITDRELATVDDLVGSWQPAGAPPEPVTWHVDPSPQMLSIVDKPGAVQSAIVITVPTVGRRHPHYFKLRLLVMALGGYFGSRLVSNVREDKGYTYGIVANLLGSAFDAYVGIATECDTKYTRAVIDEIKKELRRLRDETMGDDELYTVKQHMLSSLAKQLDTPFSIAGYVGSTIMHGVYPEYYNEQVAAIAAATPRDLQEMAQRYLPDDKLRIVIATDKSKLSGI